MAEPKVYASRSLAGVEPITFLIDEHVFRVPRKENNGVLLWLARNAVTLESDGLTHYDRPTLRTAISNLLADELWQPATTDGDDELPGQWVATDDRVRFHELLDGSRTEVSTKTLSEIVSDVLEELTGHPTGAPNS